MFEQDIEISAPYLEYSMLYDDQFKENFKKIEQINHQVQLNMSLDREEDLTDFINEYTNIESSIHILLSLNKQLFLSYIYDKLLEKCVVKNIKVRNDRYELYIYNQKPGVNVLKNNFLIMERNKMSINASYIGHDIKSREIIYKTKELFKELRQAEVRNKALENKISEIKKFIDQF